VWLTPELVEKLEDTKQKMFEHDTQVEFERYWKSLPEEKQNQIHRNTLLMKAIQKRIGKDPEPLDDQNKR